MGDSKLIPWSRMLVLCCGWWVALTLHFLTCGWLAWKLGSVPDLPAFLGSVDPMVGRFGYALSTAFEFVWLLLWWAIVGVTFVGVWYFVHGVDSACLWWDRRKNTTRVSKSGVGSSAAAMWPLLTLSILNLLMMPARAVNRPETPTGMEVATAMGWDAWTSYLLLSIPILTGLGLLLATIIVLAQCIPNRVEGCLAMSLGVLAIIGGLCVMGGWIWLTKDLHERLHRQVGFAGAVALFYLAVTMIVCVPLLMLSRRRAR